MSEVPLIEARGIAKRYDGGLVTALAGIDLRLYGGKAVALRGPSGSGKSTLLRILGAMEQPTSGEIYVRGQPLAAAGRAHRFRARSVGFIFQMHYLLPHLSLQENVEIPLIALGMRPRQRRRRAADLLAELGLVHRAGFTPTRVSGGERQRTAIARALANEPSILLCDEPTGSLDSRTGQAILEVLFGLRNERGVTLLVATHDPAISERADHVLNIQDGRISGAES